MFVQGNCPIKLRFVTEHLIKGGTCVGCVSCSSSICDAIKSQHTCASAEYQPLRSF